MNKDQFLFRGVRSYDKNVIEGNLIIDNEGEKHIVPFDMIDRDGHHLRIDSDEPMFFEQDSINQFSGLTDKSSIRIFSDDIRIDHLGVKFRIYQTVGGFVVKSSVWASNLNDLVLGDELVTSSLSDPQTAAYICESTVGFSNVWDEKQLKK